MQRKQIRLKLQKQTQTDARGGDDGAEEVAWEGAGVRHVKGLPIIESHVPIVHAYSS